MGAYGIDADSLTQFALQKGSPAVDKIVCRFGNSVFHKMDGIDRGKLAAIVFSDKQALQDLESILHPLVATATTNLINRARLPIIVIEAVKLLESDLAGMCDSVWVVDAEDTVIYERLEQQRNMQPEQIRERLANQSPAEEKIRHADVVITNNKDILYAWGQVENKWSFLIKKDKRFSRCYAITADLLNQSNEILVTPGSKLFNRIGVTLAKQVQINWFFNTYPFYYSEGSIDHPQVALDTFIFSSNHTYPHRSFTIWHLSQFYLVLIGHQNTEPKKKSNIDLSKLDLIEHFGKLHMAQRIIIPVSTHNNEGAASLGTKNYEPTPPDHADISKLSIAGYNVFQKSLNDVYDLFTDGI